MEKEWGGEAKDLNKPLTKEDMYIRGRQRQTGHENMWMASKCISPLVK